MYLNFSSKKHVMVQVWDEELAEKASKWAEKEEFKHNPDRTIGTQISHQKKKKNLD